MNLKDLYEASRTRAAKQRVIEDAIERFNPDFCEAADFIAAIKAALKFGEKLDMELESCFNNAIELLLEADNTRWVARHDDNWTDMEREEELATQQRVNDE